MLSKEQLRNKCVNTTRRYDVVTFADGNKARIQSLTRSEQRKWRKATKRKDGTEDPEKIEYSNDVLCAMVLVDDAGETVFTVDEALRGMFDLWDTQDSTILVDGAVRHCGLVIADTTKEIEARIKNSEGIPGNGSSSANADDSGSPNGSTTNDSTTTTS